MKISKKFQHVTITEQIYHTTRNDYEKKTYDIEIDDAQIAIIHEDTMKLLYEKMDKILFPQKGGAS